MGIANYGQGARVHRKQGNLHMINGTPKTRKENGGSHCLWFEFMTLVRRKRREGGVERVIRMGNHAVPPDRYLDTTRGSLQIRNSM